MKRRIARTIVGVVALVVTVLVVPFAIVVQRFYESRATVELQRSAAEAIAELTVPLDPEEIAVVAREPDAPPDFSVYDATGVRLYGEGPAQVDVAQRDHLVVISPITDRSTETVVGFVRVSEPRSTIAGEARRAWGLMGLAALGGIGLAFVVARREAARLAAPISALAARAERLGSGELDQPSPETGLAELDTLGDALTISNRRLAELLAREREFSANASHQLRTPLAALQLALGRDDVSAASIEADRIAATVDHMLALARGALPEVQRVDVAPIVDAALRRWRAAYEQAGRHLEGRVDSRPSTVSARVGSLEQVLDVLLDNSLRHGAGRTRLAAQSVRGGVVIQIDDDGPGIDPAHAGELFDHRDETGARIGLALARTLIEADGGRLVLADVDHAEFRVVFAHPPDVET